MANTIVIALGTTPCTVALTFLRKLEAGLRTFQKLDRHDYRDQEWVQLINDVQVVGLDVDEPQKDESAVSYYSDSIDWTRNQNFFRLRAPDPKLIDLDTPQNLRFSQDYLNERLYSALGGADNAAGGGPPNGFIITSFNQELVLRLIRSFFDNRQQDTPISFYVISSTFGGFGSGSKELILRWIRQEASNRQLGNREIKLFPIIMIPGEKSASNSKVMSTTGARLREISAHMTKSYSFKNVNFDGSCQNITLELEPRYCLLSSANYSITNFNCLCADLLYSWIATPLRAKIDSRISADVYLPNAMSGVLSKWGEQRLGASVGTSKIFLGSVRFKEYSVTRLQIAVIEHLLKPLNEIENQFNPRIEPFLVRQKLWGRIDYLVEDLLETASQKLGGKGDILNRFADAFDKHIENIRNHNISTNSGYRTNQLSLNEIEDVIEQATTDVEIYIFQDKRKIKKFRDERIHLFKLNFSDEVKSLLALGFQAVVDFAQRVYKILQDIKEKIDKSNSSTSVLDRGNDPIVKRNIFIERLKITFKTLLSEIVEEIIFWVNQQIEGIESSIEAIEGLRNDLGKRLSSIITSDLNNFECPNGKVLFDKEESLSSYYSKWYEIRNIEMIISNLDLNLENPAGYLRDYLEIKTVDILDPVFKDMDVVKVLLELYPEKNQLLKVLREAESMSSELIKLNADNIKPECVVKVVGIPGSRSNEIMNFISMLPNRGGEYIKVDGFNDPEQIVFLNYRAGIAYSDWAYFSNAMKVYTSVRKKEPREILHPAVVDRFLPTPGSRLSPDQVHLIAVQGWLLGRWTKEMPWILKTTTKRIDFDNLYEDLSYLEAVDISSNFGIQCFNEGIRFLKDRLSFLVESDNGIDLKIAQMYLEVKHILDKDLDICLVSSLEGWIDRQLEKKRNARDAAYIRILDRVDSAHSYEEIKQILGLIF